MKNDLKLNIAYIVNHQIDYDVHHFHEDEIISLKIILTTNQMNGIIKR